MSTVVAQDCILPVQTAEAKCYRCRLTVWICSL